MAIDFLREVFREFEDDDAILEDGRALTFGGLLAAVDAAGAELAAAGVGAGAVLALEADFGVPGIALLLAAIERGAIVVPIAPTSAERAAQWLEVAQVEFRVRAGGGPATPTGRHADHPLYARLRAAGHGGLVLFTSGSTGEPKATLHDWTRLLGKYRTRRHRLRTVLFLLFDHIGGIDTLFQALSNGSAVIVPAGRTPEAVCAAIERHRAEVLPASPSFLGLLLLSEAHRRHDLSSLRYITYGAEVMPAATLARLAAAFPGVRLLQKYGLTELGTLRSQSDANDSLWVRVGGEGFRTRVVEGRLEILADSSMLGYLNAPSPFTADGWFMTGDAVEVRGEFYRILGRASDLINVAGRKVYPAEVEAVIHELDNVAEVAVRGAAHPFTGQIVVARVRLRRPEDVRALERRVRAHCQGRLPDYAVPARVEIAADALHSDRQKVERRARP
jgi:acyl-CoA synthetase (AMP-forming)/AMP-acid ligase II